MNRRASVQATHLHIEAIEDDLVRLRGGHYRAVLEVSALNFRMLGEVEQEAVIAGFAAFLNSLTFPIQILVRVLPLDLEPYARRLEERAVRAEPALARLARAHVAFLRGFARTRTLLERRFYVVVPADPAGPPVRRWWPFARRVPALEGEAAAKQLTSRCDHVARELGRCRLTVRRLSTPDLYQLFYASWCSDLSRVQRLRRDLIQYLVPVVASPR